jgi:hypothetical protein
MSWATTRKALSHYGGQHAEAAHGHHVQDPYVQVSANHAGCYREHCVHQNGADNGQPRG